MGKKGKDDWIRFGKKGKEGRDKRKRKLKEKNWIRGKEMKGEV